MTPSQRRMLAFIDGGGERGRMLLQIVGSGGSAGKTFGDLQREKWIELNRDIPVDRPEFYRATVAGRAALAARITFRRDEDRYIVYLGDERIGFVRRYPEGFDTARKRQNWNATDTFMEKDRDFLSRAEAGEWLRSEFESRQKEEA